jgi:hypothetical protein
MVVTSAISSCPTGAGAHSSLPGRPHTPSGTCVGSARHCHALKRLGLFRSQPCPRYSFAGGISRNLNGSVVQLMQQVWQRRGSGQSSTATFPFGAFLGARCRLETRRICHWTSFMAWLAQLRRDWCILEGAFQQTYGSVRLCVVAFKHTNETGLAQTTACPAGTKITSPKPPTGRAGSPIIYLLLPLRPKCPAQMSCLDAILVKSPFLGCSKAF